MTYNPNTRGTVPASKATSRVNANQTGAMIPKCTPVRVTSSGLAQIDVSLEGDVDAFAGVLKEDAANNTPGTIVSSGTVEAFSTGFAVGSTVYISKVGTLTNTKPQMGSGGFGAGDFVIKIGVIAKNNDNALLKDLVLGIQIMGQL